MSSSLVTLDGSVCNKIGTSYSAFRYQTVRSAQSTPCHIAAMPSQSCQGLATGLNKAEHSPVANSYCNRSAHKG